MARALLVFVLLLPLAGCGLFQSRQTRALHASPDYRAGYDDGCASAGGPDANPRADSQVRDAQLYATSKAYRAGWGAGHGACRNYAPGSQPMPGTGPIPDVSPGARPL